MTTEREVVILGELDPVVVVTVEPDPRPQHGGQSPTASKNRRRRDPGAASTRGTYAFRSMVWTMVLVAGSMRTSVASLPFTAHTNPPAAWTRCTPGTSIVATSVPSAE